MAVQQEQDGLERLSRDFLYVLFGDFGERERGGALEVDVVRVGKGRQSAQRVAGEKVGGGAVCARESGGVDGWRERAARRFGRGEKEDTEGRGGGLPERAIRVGRTRGGFGRRSRVVQSNEARAKRRIASRRLPSRIVDEEGGDHEEEGDSEEGHGQRLAPTLNSKNSEREISWHALSRYCNKSATASRSLSSKRGSYGADDFEPAGRRRYSRGSRVEYESVVGFIGECACGKAGRDEEIREESVRETAGAASDGVGVSLRM